MILTREGLVRVLQLGSALRLVNASGEAVSTHPYTVHNDGRVAVTEDPAAAGQGPVTGCEIVTPDGLILATGTTGLSGSGADVELDHLDIQRGSRVEQTGSAATREA